MYSLEPCILIHVTAKAILIRFRDNTEHWIPKSQISMEQDIQDIGYEQWFEFALPDWFIEKANLEDYVI